MYAYGYNAQKSSGDTAIPTKPNGSINSGQTNEYRNHIRYTSNDEAEITTVRSGSVFKGLPMPPPETPSIRDFKSAREIADDSRKTRIIAQKTLVPTTPCLNPNIDEIPQNETRVSAFRTNGSGTGDKAIRVGSFSNTDRGLKEARVKSIDKSDRWLANSENVGNDAVGKLNNGLASYRPRSSEFEPYYYFGNNDEEYSIENSDISDSPFRSFAIPAKKQTVSDVVSYNADRSGALKNETKPTPSGQQIALLSKSTRPRLSHPSRMASSITVKEKSCPSSQVSNELSMNVCTTGSSFGAVNINEKIGQQVSGVGGSYMRFKRSEENYFDNRNEIFKSPEMQKQKIARFV